VPLQLAKAAYIAPTTPDAEFFQDVELWAVPMLNVDGHYFSENYSRIWRKSRRAFVDPFGVACFGVDLNRNYPLGFGGGMSGTSDASIETFSGPKAFSEPETRALRDLCCREHFSGVLSFHAYGNEILYPWAYLPPDADSRETSEARSVALAMGAVMMHKGGAAYTVLQSYNHYDVGVGGDFCDWVFGEFGKIALTIELGPPDFEMQLPSPMIGSVVNEFWPGFLKFVEAAK
jgi:carboxypeptidase T